VQINQAMAMQVSDGYLYCCSKGAHIVAWCLAVDQDKATV
jgi:hypothetical protein